MTVYCLLNIDLYTEMKQETRIAIIGDFEPDRLSHKATYEALLHAAGALSLLVRAEWLPTVVLETEAARTRLGEYHGIFCAPGSPYKSMIGALAAIRFSREQGWPFIGT